MAYTFVNAGIKEIYFTSGKVAFPALGTSGVYTDVFGMGIRQNASLVGNHFSEFRDNKNRAFPNLFNFKLDTPTMQVDNYLFIKELIDAAAAGAASVAMISAGVTKTGTTPDFTASSLSGGLFVFDEDDALGIDFELRFGLKERVCNISFERAFKYGASGAGTHGAILTAAKTNTLKFDTTKLPMITVADVVDSYISPDFLPAALTTGGGSDGAFDDLNIVDWMVSVKTKSNKNGFNGSMVSGLQVELTAQAMGGDIDSMIAAAEYEFFNSATPISIDLGTTTLKFAKDGMTRIGDFDVSDDNRNIRFTYTGEYDIEYVGTGVSNEITFNAHLV